MRAAEMRGNIIVTLSPLSIRTDLDSHQYLFLFLNRPSDVTVKDVR